MRIAAVQHGDYSEACRIIESGSGEPYFGMGYSLTVLKDLFGANPYLVVSLDGPSYRERQGDGVLLGLPRPNALPFLPLSISFDLWARRIVKELRSFRPTHILLRTGGPIASHVLDYCIKGRINTLVVFASRFDSSTYRSKLSTARLVRQLNDPCIRLVGNHKQPATDSMVDCGVIKEKVLAWDWPGARHPRSWPTKQLSNAGKVASVVYVGAISKLKGIYDLVLAVKILWERGQKLNLTFIGGGPDLEDLRLRAAELPHGFVTIAGRLPNEEAFEHMLNSDLVCVPTHHGFPEGMPLTLTEALASRTPVVVSDHPLFVHAFQDGEGVRFCRANDPVSLADTISDVVADDGRYKFLSETTWNAFSRVECKTTFGDLITRWRAAF